MKSLHFILPVLLPVLLCVPTNRSARADSATWKLDPISSDWNTPDNWTPATVPRFSSDTATFGLSNNPNPSLSAPIDLGEMVFTPGASEFTVASDHERTLNLFGAGITNNSGVQQNFVLNAFRGVIVQMVFHNGSTAGDGTVFTVDGPSILPSLFFIDTSSAGSSARSTNAGLSCRATAPVAKAAARRLPYNYAPRWSRRFSARTSPRSGQLTVLSMSWKAWR